MPEKRKSAFLRATQEAQALTPTVSPSVSNTVTPSNSETVEQHERPTAKKDEKITFYLTSSQANKLDDLAYEHKKRTGRRINRNDIVRHLIDQCDIDSLRGQ
jgi:hypothetical protein